MSDSPEENSNRKVKGTDGGTGITREEVKFNDPC